MNEEIVYQLVKCIFENLDQVYRIHAAAVYVKPENLIYCDIEYHPGTMKLFIRGDEVPLSTKEHALLRLFMENKGRVFTKEQLYERIWGETIVDENAIMVYVSRLRSKLEADPKNPSHILTVWGVGYKFAD
jgi:DNA-binding response OmpR family regulator